MHPSKKKRGRKTEQDVRRAFRPDGIYLVPKFLAPVYEQIQVALNVLGALAAPHGVHLDPDLLRTQPSQNAADAGLQERFSVPVHAQLHDLGEDGVPAEQGLMRFEN